MGKFCAIQESGILAYVEGFDEPVDIRKLWSDNKLMKSIYRFKYCD